MAEITTICFVCEEDITITERDIKLAIQHKKDTGGKVLVSCPNCCRVLVMPEDMPEEGADLAQWITDVGDVMCVPMLEEDYIRIPAGKSTILGKTTYMPGGGSGGLMKRPYMFKYGISPDCALAKNVSTGGEPIVIGGN